MTYECCGCENGPQCKETSGAYRCMLPAAVPHQLHETYGYRNGKFVDYVFETGGEKFEKVQVG